MDRAPKQAAPGTRLIERPQGPNVLVLRKARLVVEEGPDRGRELQIERTWVRIGSDPDNDLVLRDDAVSAHHFELAATDVGCLLRDLGSTNGTLVDGLRVREVFLRDQSEVEVGSTVLRYRLGPDEVEIPVSRATNFGALLGHSPAMQAVFAVLEQAARSEATVLLQGESGTGKELAARALHDHSTRRQGPYVVFDCGAAAPSLLESQLFGHVRGAFTGADAARAGVFEEASGGTLVIDELGELPLELQPKLLRALEQRTVTALGETRPRAVDVRFVASTNRNLEEEVRAGRFRQDLFFRVSVVAVRLPPLRERREEIPRLVRHFLTSLPGGSGAAAVSRPILELLQRHDWPGNVRELRNFVERLVAMPGSDPATLLDTSASAPDGESMIEINRPFHEARRDWNDRFERAYLTVLLERTGGNVSEVARIAGLSRQTCYRLMQKHGIRSE